MLPVIIIIPWAHPIGNALIVTAFLAKLFAFWVDLAVSIWNFKKIHYDAVD
jgi:hypothetical protein